MCDSGILLTAARAQIEFNNAFGDGFMDNNTVTGNTIRNFPGAGIEFDNAGTNNVVSHNLITENVLGGILLAHRCPSCEYKFMRNDIVNNAGTPLVSLDSVYGQNFVRTLLGPLPVDIAGDDGLGNPVGNFWGRVCGDDEDDDDDDQNGDGPLGPPFFNAGVDSNALDVIDNSPFGVPVASLEEDEDDDLPLPPGCEEEDD